VSAEPVVGEPNPLKPRDRVKIPRQHPDEQDAAARARNFEEVSRGFDEERARLEALRCLDCRDPFCVAGCPVNVDIPGFIRLLLQGDYGGAAARIRETNALPAVCGRVCPQESQCEAVCTVGKRFEPLAIGKLERFVADWDAAHPNASTVGHPVGAPHQTARARVAVVGSGPAGLACAADLAHLGYAVTVFEALHAAGGVLRYGIPEFRLPREVLEREIESLRQLGVTVRTNVVIGRTLTVDELLAAEGFQAAFLATGAGTPAFLGIPGEGLCGVYSANEFLTRVNLMGANRFPRCDTPIRPGRSVAVIGGGNTAIDAVRTALRLGAERAAIVYRRSLDFMPARVEEIQHAKEEGVRFLFQTNPLRILGDGDGNVVGLEIQRTEPGEPDASGRRRPVPVPGSEEVIAVDTVVEAIGQQPNPIVQATTPGLETGRGGVVVVDDRQQTSRPGVFAGGDLSRGGATVILAMRDGRHAAAAIHEALSRAARFVQSDTNGTHGRTR
jgi:glutamate synthase (NADPH/NADH) small chain